MKIRSLSGRVVLLLGVATVVIFGLAAAVMDRMVDAGLAQRFDASLLAEARALAALESPARPGHVQDAGHLRARAFGRKPSSPYAVRCADGGRRDSDPAPAYSPSGWSRRARARPQFADLGDAEHAWRAVWFRFNAEADDDALPPAPDSAAAAGGGNCAMLFMQPRHELDTTLADIDAILLLTPGLGLLAVLVLSRSLVRHGLKPLATLGEHMRRIGPQAGGQRLRATGTVELDPLVARFNEVLARMDEGVARERQFADALAHETRTRLAELRALVEVEQRYPSERPLAQLLGEIGSIGRELESTVAGLLLLTRLDAGIEGLNREPIDIDGVLARQLEHVAAVVRQRQLQIDIEPSAEVAPMMADRALLDIVIGNLVRNAVAYAPEGSSIRIQRAPCALTIGNPAPDLHADDLARFGERFWSKHHGTEDHFGLGLALMGAAARTLEFHLDFAMDAQHYLRAQLRWGGSAAAMDEPDAAASGSPPA